MASLKKRSGVYYAQYYVGTKQRRISLRTSSYQLAKEKLRQIESRLAQGEDNPLPTRTPIAEIVGRYVDHIRQHKTEKSAQTDVYYLREAFGPICEQLEITSRRPTEKARKRQLVPGAVQDRRRRPLVIEAPCVRLPLALVALGDSSSASSPAASVTLRPTARWRRRGRRPPRPLGR